jgi:hypothetical protein
VAEGAGNAHGAQRALVVEEALDADDRVELEKSERRCRVVEVDLSFGEGLLQWERQRVHVDLQAYCKCCLGTDAAADTAEILALDRPVKPELASPEGLIAEGVEAEDLLAAFKQLPALNRINRVGASAAARPGDGTDSGVEDDPAEE